MKNVLVKTWDVSCCDWQELIVIIIITFSVFNKIEHFLGTVSYSLYYSIVLHLSILKCFKIVKCTLNVSSEWLKSEKIFFCLSILRIK